MHVLVKDSTCVCVCLCMDGGEKAEGKMERTAEEEKREKYAYVWV